MPRRQGQPRKRGAHEEEDDAPVAGPGGKKAVSIPVSAISKQTAYVSKRARQSAQNGAATQGTGNEDDEGWESVESSDEDADIDADGYINEEGYGDQDGEEIVYDDDEESEEESEDETEAAERAADEDGAAKRQKVFRDPMQAASAAMARADETAPTPGSDRRIWRRDRGEQVGSGQNLEYSSIAYDCFFQLRTEYPCLSFDIMRDNEGACRTSYPLSMMLACGTQAGSANNNQIVLLKVSNLLKTKNDDGGAEDESDEEMIGDQKHIDSDGDEDSNHPDDIEEINNGEPMVNHRTIRHHGTINRLRLCPQEPNLCATWSDAANVQVFDLQNDAHALADFANWSREEAAAAAKTSSQKEKRTSLKFISSSSTHSTEGYAIGWNKLDTATFASGDCHGDIFCWLPAEGGRWTVGSNTGKQAAARPSVEEITWSPTQSHVLICGRATGLMEVWDTRKPLTTPQLQWRADPTDINVCDWNKSSNASHLVVSGADSGFVRLWDLRKVLEQTLKKQAVEPLQELCFHEGCSITSVEFSEHNESLVSVTSADGQCTLWDMSLERDPDEEKEVVGELFDRPDLAQLPDQLMFQHQGLTTPKEAHWHSQIPGMAVVTDYYGLHMFKPMNWRSLMK